MSSHTLSCCECYAEDFKRCTCGSIRLPKVCPPLAVIGTLLVLMLGSTLPLNPARAASLAQGLRSSDTSTLYVAYPLTPQTLDPAIMYDFGGPAVARNCYDTLLTLEGSGTKVVGDLATSWSSNASKTIWTFHLRHGVLFHDGTPLDAQAVKDSIVRIFKVNQAPSFIMGQFLTADRIKVLDPYTIQFNLIPTSPYYAFITALTSQWGNMIVSPTAVKKHSVHGDLAQGWLATHEAGSGPYELTSYQLNQGATFTAFPSYFKGWSGHHVKRVVMSFVQEDATRREEIEKGSADISVYFTPQDLNAMKQEHDLVVENAYGTNSYFITFTEYGPLASTAARQAMAYAFDYNAYVSDLLQGYGRIATGPMAATVTGHDPSLKPHPMDVAMARTLLQKAGIKPGTTFTMWYLSTDERMKQLTQVMQGQFAQLGLTCNCRLAIPIRTTICCFPTRRGQSQRPNFWANQWTPDYDDPIDFMTPLYHSKGNPLLGGGSNAGFYHNKTVDHLLEQAARTPAAQVRKNLLNQNSGDPDLR